MSSAKKFEDLVVWQKVHQLVIKIYQLSKSFPQDELFDLATQLRRAAVSVPVNISEGFKRATIRDKLRYLNIAQGSLEEVQVLRNSILCQALEYGNIHDFKKDLEEVSRILEGYMKSLKRKFDFPGS